MLMELVVFAHGFFTAAPFRMTALDGYHLIWPIRKNTDFCI